MFLKYKSNKALCSNSRYFITNKIINQFTLEEKQQTLINLILLDTLLILNSKQSL